MKKTAKFFVVLLAILMLSSAVSAFALGEFKSEASGYDQYGYYTYFDFENYAHSDHLAYFRGGSKNDNGLVCDPYGFVLTGQGNLFGTGSVVTEEDGNTYYHFVQGGNGANYAVMAVFETVDPNGNDVLLGDSIELSFKFRLSGEQTEAEDKKMALVNVRRNGDNYPYLASDIYGNLYIQVSNGNYQKIYTNSGDGKFMDISFRWYDTSNTYSVFVNGEAAAESIPFFVDYRANAKVAKTYDDDFNVAGMSVVGGTAESATRTIEFIRQWNNNDAFVYDVDDIKLSRIETAQGGAVYYENGFDSDVEGISRLETRGVYLYNGTPTSSTIALGSENGDGYLQVSSGQYIGLDDHYYQAYTQGNVVFEFSVKGKPTHTSGRKGLFRLNDSFCATMYKPLLVDPDGYLYIEDSDDDFITGYRLNDSEWLDIAIVVIKNRANSGKFPTFNASTTKSNNANYSLTFAYYINGNFVGTSIAKTHSKISKSTYSNQLVTASGHSYSITDYTTTLDVSSLTLIDETTNEGHKIYKSVVDGVTTYYDVTFDDNGNQVKYSAMVIGNFVGNDENIRFFTDSCFDAKLDNVRVYEGTAPDYVYEGANAESKATVLNVDFGKFTFPTKGVESRTNTSGPDVLGTFITSGVTNGFVTHKDANGNAVTKATTESSDHITLNMVGGAWFDYYVPMPKKVNGGLDFTYTFETKVKNFTFGNEDSPSIVDFFSIRLEDNSGFYPQTMLSVDSDLNLHISSNGEKLYDANGNAVKLDNETWNSLRVDLHFYKGANGGSLDATYYLNDQPLYLEDGSSASAITSIFGSNIGQRVGVDNVRVRYIPQIASEKNIFVDAKSFTISTKPGYRYTEVEAEQTNFIGTVTAIEFTIPKYVATSAGGRYEALSLVKASGDAEGKLALITVDPMSGKIFVGLGGQLYELLDKSGDAFVVPNAGLPVTVVYNDVDGLARYYVNGAPAYIELGTGLGMAAEIGIYDASFAQLSGTGDYKYLVFSGVADDANAFDEEDYDLTTYNIGKKDNATIIGFQKNDENSDIRLVAGVNSLYYTSVGFEIEGFEDGVSGGVKDVVGYKVFESIISGGETITAADLGYKYIAAFSVSQLPDAVADDSYILIRAYTAIGEDKHYDDMMKLVLTSDGYYFDKDGTVYQNNFNGVQALPSEWKLAGNSTHIANGKMSAALSAKGEVEFNVTENDKAFFYLDQYVGDDYLFQFDFTVTDSIQGGSYIAPVFGYKDLNNFGYAYIRIDDYSEQDAQGKIQTNNGGSWNTPTGGAFSTEQLGLLFEEGKTYTLTLTVKDNHVALFVNGSFVAECDVADGLADGKIGICSKGVSLLVDDVIVKTGDNVSDSYFLYSEDFNGINALPTGWVTDVGNSKSSAGVTADGKLRLIQPTGNYMLAYYNTAMTSNDYSVEAEFTITAKQKDDKYFGLVYGLQDVDNFGMSYVRFNGTNCATEVRQNGAWASSTTFSATDAGITFAVGGTYKLTAVRIGTSVKFYVDNILVSEATIPEGYSGGKIGFITSGINLDVDNLKVCEIGETIESEGTPYSQSFDGTATLPADWKTVDVSGATTIGIADYSNLVLKNMGDNFMRVYLDSSKLTANDYVYEADITLKDYVTTDGYFGLTLRNSDSNYIFCAVRVNGGGFVQGNNSSAYAYYPTWQATDKGLSFAKGKTYTFKAICQGDTIKFYVDDVLIAEGTNPDSGTRFDAGTIGIACKRVTLAIENVKVTDIAGTTTLYTDEFNDVSAISTNWKKSGTNSTYTVTSSQAGALAINEKTTTALAHAVIKDGVGYNDYSVSADITLTSTGNYIGPMARYKNNNHYVFVTIKQGGKVTLECKKSGGWTTISSLENAVPAWNVGETRNVKLVCQGMYAYAYIDGKLIVEGVIPEGYEEGTVGIAAKGIGIEVDSFNVAPISELSLSEEIYSESFDMTPNVPKNWIHEEGAQRINGYEPEMSVVVNSTDMNDGKLALSAMGSTLTVIALDELLEYDSFIYEVDITMTERSSSSNVSYYMGPVFGLQDDSTCGLATMKVNSGDWNIEAWLTRNVSSPWIGFASGSYGATDINTPYRFKIVGADGYLTLYINGVEQTKCAIDDPYLDGRFGIAFRNSEILVDNVKIYKQIELFDIVDKENPTTRIKVATFNIGDFSTASGTANLGIDKGNGTDKTKQEYVDVFKKVGADIWGLQEDSQYFNGNSKESPYDAIYSEALPYYQRKFSGTYNGKAFASNFEIYDVEQVYYNKVVTSYAPNGTTDYGHKWFLAAKVMIDGKEVTLITLHFDWACKERRFQQIRDVIAYAQQCEYAIILGDFNPENYVNGNKVADPNDEHYVNGSDYVNMYQVDWKFFTDAGFEPANGGRFGAYETLMRNGKPRGGFPWDSVFVSSNIKITNAYPVYESWMNDHAIFVAELELN